MVGERPGERDWIRNPGTCRQERARSRMIDTKDIRSGADTSSQNLTRFQQPDQFRGPFLSLRHLSGVFEGEGLCEGLVER